MRHSGNNAHQISEDLLRAISEELNRGREGSDIIIPCYSYLKEDADVSCIPDVVIAIRSGTSPVDRELNNIHHFRSLGSMQDGIVSVLRKRHPVLVPDPESPLTLEQVHDEVDVVVEASRLGVPDEGLIGILKNAQTAPGQIG